MNKIYPHDKAKIAANNATAAEREAWNQRVQDEKEARDAANRRTFVPRKASHKQGYKLG